MGNWLNTYQKVTSQTGKPVTLFTDHAPWRDNPWVEIQGAGRRYRNNGKGGWEIQQVSQSSGTWDPINVVDEEYWTNYINDIDKKRKETPAQNIFQKLFGIEGKTPEKACGGKVQKGEDGMVAGEFPPNWNQGEIRQGFQRQPKTKAGQAVKNWLGETSENLNKTPVIRHLVAPVFDYVTGQGNGYENMAAILPGGTKLVYTSGRLVKPVEKMSIKELEAGMDQLAKGKLGKDFNLIPQSRTKAPERIKSYKQMLSTLQKRITPEGFVKETRLYGRPKKFQKAPFKMSDFDMMPYDEKWYLGEADGFIYKQGGKISDLLNNQEFLTTLQKCGGKMKKKK